MNKLRVGFIGTGRISDLHAMGYLQDGRSTIVAVSDVNRELALKRGAAWGVRENHIFADYHDLLSLPDVDVVEILLPHHLHRIAAVEAARAKKHVCLQKPMALTMAEADEIIETTKHEGVMLKIFENFIFYPPVQRAKALIEAGEIGDPLTIHIKSNSATSPNAWEVPRSAWAWRFNRAENGGGPLVFDDGHHKFALAWHFMGQAEEVHAWIGGTELPEGIVLDAPAIISWKFPGNRYGSLEVVNSPQMIVDTRFYAQDDRIEITGTRGVIWVTRGHGKMLDVPPVVLYRDGRTFGYSDMQAGWEHSFINSTQHFIESYLTGKPPVLTGEQGREVLRLLLAAHESAQTGRSVRL